MVEDDRKACKEPRVPLSPQRRSQGSFFFSCSEAAPWDVSSFTSPIKSPFMASHPLLTASLSLLLAI